MWIKAAVLVAVVLALAAAEHRCEGLKICNVDDLKLMKCVPAVTKGNPKPPTEECCQAIAGADMKCMCAYKNSPVFSALGIDVGLCMQLPPKCGLSAPTC